ncbi:ankyrin repeat-containing domain protein [Baffinella frigidus]|nr:ankyrin repeat-containing domain protein [Cryptophyta sp. CCMP2293]
MGAVAKAATDLIGNTPLHLACRIQEAKLRMDIIHQLVQGGADVNAKNRDNLNEEENDDEAGGRTPLHIATTYSHDDAVKFLLDNGADISVAEREGHNALHWAVQTHHYQSFKEADRMRAHPRRWHAP